MAKELTCIKNPAKQATPTVRPSPTKPSASLSSRPTISCPARRTVQIAHPTDCKKFIKCYSGRRYTVHTCNHHYLYNSATSQCDYPRKVTCPKPSHQNGQGTGLWPEGHGRPAVELRCPSGYSGTKPHPKSCTKFIECVNGRQYIKTCAFGTRFHSQSLMCDFAGRVDCSDREGNENVTSSVTSSISQFARRVSFGLDA